MFIPYAYKIWYTLSPWLAYASKEIWAKAIMITQDQKSNVKISFLKYECLLDSSVSGFSFFQTFSPFKNDFDIFENIGLHSFTVIEHRNRILICTD